MTVDTILSGVIIGGFGGAIAGLCVYGIQELHNSCKLYKESKRVFFWLKEHTSKETKFRSTRSIASYNNLTMDRTRYVCSHHKKIFLSTGEQEDMWSVWKDVRK